MPAFRNGFKTRISGATGGLSASVFPAETRTGRKLPGAPNRQIPVLKQLLKHFASRCAISFCATLALASPALAGPFNIVIDPGPDLAANAPALAAFQRAAANWSSRFIDPITVTINADLGTFDDPNTIGGAGAVNLYGDYAEVRNQMVLDAADEPFNAIVANLPTAAQFVIRIPDGTTLHPYLGLTKANAKALGFEGMDAAFGVSDGTIIFNRDFAFDYDASDGIAPATMDFETVALHEIGHILGFISATDDFDYGGTDAVPTTLDLFRFAASEAPTTPEAFTTTPRDIVPGNTAVLSDTANAWLLSTGANQGDRRQASHWKDASLTGLYLGALDPTLDYGQTFSIAYPDRRAFDLIGYDLVPLPSPLLAGLALLLPLLARRPRHP